MCGEGAVFAMGLGAVLGGGGGGSSLLGVCAVFLPRTGEAAKQPDELEVREEEEEE